jgi:hypothetical protein
MDRQKNAVPLNVHPFHLKENVLQRAFKLNIALATAEMHDLKGHTLKVNVMRR